MFDKKFKIGDRVVYTAWGAPFEGVGGTVIQVEVLPNPSGVTWGRHAYLRVILDTAEVIDDEAAVFQHEGDYDPRIPF